MPEPVVMRVGTSPVEDIGPPPPGVSGPEWRTRVHLAACYRMLAGAGFDDLTYNHLSARVPNAPGCFLVKGDDQLFEQCTARSLALCDFAGLD